MPVVLSQVLTDLYLASAGALGASLEAQPSALQPDEWDKVLELGELHGVAPLLYSRLSSIETHLPVQFIHKLRLLSHRHQAAAQIRQKVLLDTLIACEEAKVDMLLLKGIALSMLVYPEAALRPMRDIDILVRKEDLFRVRELLLTLDFQIDALSADQYPEKHLVATKLIDGMSISVEAHHKLFDDEYGNPVEFDDLLLPRVPIDVSDQTAFTLSPEEMLWHVSRHLVESVNYANQVRLIWFADVLFLVRCYADEIDWDYVHMHFPIVVNVLSLMHCVLPLPDTVQDMLPIDTKISSHDLLPHFDGWPSASWSDLRQHLRWIETVYNTFIPSAWWIRWHYGLNVSRPLLFHRLAHIRDVMHKAIEAYGQ